MAETKHDSATRVVVRALVGGKPQALNILTADGKRMGIDEARSAAQFRAAQARKAGRVGVEIIEWTPAAAGTAATVTL